MRLSIGKLSNKTGVNIETIRYYERITLMPPPFRTEGGHRIYDNTHMERLSFIRRCRDLGFPLEDIRSLLGMVEKDDHCATMRPTAKSHLQLVKAKIKALREMQRALTDILDCCSDCDTPTCSVSNALFGCAARSCACCGRADLETQTIAPH
ncbi:MAG: helix-turn-helix domain-containing protein [Kordiimonadaceae bacterium]|nr:helix-turn-helix domain-containing protein [Kordiimonadaceae bacterium]